VFLAGATGVIGRELVPLLVGDGHVVAGMTRSPGKAGALREAGAEPVVCDVYDRTAVLEVVGAFAPDVVIDELTDLPDDLSLLRGHSGANARIRTEGTRNLLDAAAAAGVPRFLAQSVAWDLGGEGQRAVAEHERMVLDVGGVVLRYGMFWGPGTYLETEPTGDDPRIHVATGARRTVELLEAPSGVYTILD
jgi:nucleoside-diphosphate-sugar epimerase